MTENLKRCPFCGSEAEFNSDEFGEGVCCKSCGATMHNGVYGEEGRKLASDDWNTRTIENELPGKIGKLESENKRLREALEFYANTDVYEYYDKYESTAIQNEGGQKAREALKELLK